MSAETPRARHDNSPRQTARGQLGPALCGCDRSPRKEATAGGKQSPRRGPSPRSYTRVGTTRAAPRKQQNPGKNPPPPPTRENPKGQGATLQKVRDETRNESRIVVEGIQGSLSFSRQSLVWGRGVWKCRALGPDAALSRRPGARSSPPSLSCANSFLFFVFFFPFPFYIIFLF